MKTEKEMRRMLDLLTDESKPYEQRLEAYEYLLEDCEPVVDEMLRRFYTAEGETGKMLIEILSEYKESMRQRAENMGQAWSEESLVFLNTRDKMVYSRNLQESLYKIYRKAGIEGATMHTLRHTYATRCFEAGVDIKAISEQLGHANVKTTYNIYVHLLDDTRAKEIDKLSGIDKFIASEATTGNAVIIPFPEREKAV